MIATAPQRGMLIAPIDYKLARDAYQFRLFLEKEAVALFAVLESSETIAQLRATHEDRAPRN